MNPSDQRGSRIRGFKPVPSLDLVIAVELLTQSIEAGTATPGKPASWPLFSYSESEQRLQINTRGVLSRLWEKSLFKQAFRTSTGQGFIRDITLPPKGMDARVGGRIFAERIADLAHAVTALKEKLSAELTAFCQNKQLALADLVSEDPTAYLTALSNNLKQRFHAGGYESCLVPLQFADPQQRSAAGRTEDVARLIAAVETVESSGWLDYFEKPARRKLARRGLDDEDIGSILTNFRQEADRLDSQTARFLHFLDDDALARVRLKVTFAIMGAVREAAAARNDPGSQLLIRFIDNVTTLHNRYFNTEELLKFDVSGRFGHFGQVNVSAYLFRAYFYKCLSVWPEPVTQLFELRTLSSGHLVREVSYRFRINGATAANKTSFEARIKRFEDELIETATADHSETTRRRLAELAFLTLVIPRQEHLATPVEPIQEAARLVRFIQKTTGDPVAHLISMLKDKIEVMNRIADALVDVLRTHGGAILNRADRQVNELSICVHEDIVDWERLAAATGNSTDFFVRPTDKVRDEKTQWFQHIVVTDNPITVPGLLFSVKVRTQLRERALTRAEAGAEYLLNMRREFAGRLIPVVIQPFIAGKDPESTSWTWTPQHSLANWKIQGGIDIQVGERSLTNSGAQKDNEKEARQQQHAATTTVFAVLVYTLLWLIRERIVAKSGQAHPRFLILRAQQEGRDAANKIDGETGLTVSGSEVVYAICQAVELALACEGPVYMQGLAFFTQTRFRDSGVFAAFLSAFPLALACPEALAAAPVGLINYCTRPCSAHPEFKDDDVFFYTAKTYVAEPAVDGFPGHVLRDDRTQLHLQPEVEFREPALIFEEIGRLREQGCRHIMLLWQHYGNRRIGRTADRHAPHSTPDFLERVAERFPDITLYTLRRDVFPALRLPKKDTRHYAFEVVRVREHEDFWLPAETDVRRDLVPIYTFATLAVVGTETDRPQSGFCTYFLELDSRPSRREWAERARTDLIDPNHDSKIRPVLISVLRGLHYLHAERGLQKGQFKPKLDPHHWLAPATIAGAGELKVMGSRRKGGVILSFPAILAQIAGVLRGAKS